MWTEATVRRLVLDGTRCTGVELVRGGETVTASAEREVVVCAGTIDSPRLLLLEGIEKAAEIGAGAAFDPWRGREVLPGAHDEETLRAFLRDGVRTYTHIVGTCRMGDGPDAVVDPELRVHGITGLRVADGSVMPSNVSANTNTACVMIAEKAADLITSAAR